MPYGWALTVWGFMCLLGLWTLAASPPAKLRWRTFDVGALPLVGRGIRRVATDARALLGLRIILVSIFLLIVAAGLFGTPIPERNAATVVTWNLWWTGLIIAVFFLGSAWCAVCPWDTLANWLVRRRLWRRAAPNNSLNLRVPAGLRNVWPALILFIGLTWVELGVGVTASPYATAVLALAMVIMATVSLALYERKAFCRYFCPVGRTVGAYSQLAPVELRPIDTDVCRTCTTLECYHGSDTVEPCPTHLVMGRLRQNTYCTSCGNCARSCPSHNVSWRLRAPSVEAMQDARPRSDEAWFMLGLLALTGFHGLTMMPFWEDWMRGLARVIGDSGLLLRSFSIGLAVDLAAVTALYAVTVIATRRLGDNTRPLRDVFAGLSFVALPLAFTYHLAHNLNHLVRESSGLGAVLANPLGVATQPLSVAERHGRHMELLISQDTLFALQAGLMAFGFWLAVRIVLHRGRDGRFRDALHRVSPVVVDAADGHADVSDGPARVLQKQCPQAR
jgi:polyferredoxin